MRWKPWLVLLIAAALMYVGLAQMPGPLGSMHPPEPAVAGADLPTSSRTSSVAKPGTAVPRDVRAVPSRRLDALEQSPKQRQQDEFDREWRTQQALERALKEESRDEAWERELVDMAGTGMDFLASDGVALQDIACGSSLCRVSFEVNTVELQGEVASMLLGAGPMVGGGEVWVTSSPAGSALRATAYVSRSGKLPTN